MQKDQLRHLLHHPHSAVLADNAKEIERVHPYNVCDKAFKKENVDFVPS